MIFQGIHLYNFSLFKVLIPSFNRQVFYLLRMMNACCKCIEIMFRHQPKLQMSDQKMIIFLSYDQRFYHSTRSFTLFFPLRYFSLFKLKVVSNRLPLFSLPHFYSRQYSTLFQEVRYFSIRSP